MLKYAYAIYHPLDISLITHRYLITLCTLHLLYLMYSNIYSTRFQYDVIKKVNGEKAYLLFTVLLLITKNTKFVKISTIEKMTLKGGPCYPKNSNFSTIEFRAEPRNENDISKYLFWCEEVCRCEAHLWEIWSVTNFPLFSLEFSLVNSCHSVHNHFLIFHNSFFTNLHNSRLNFLPTFNSL